MFNTDVLRAEKSENAQGLKQLLFGSIDLNSIAAETLLPRLVHAARTHLGMDVGFISQFEGDQRFFRFSQGPQDSHLFAIDSCDSRGESYCQRVADGRLPRLVRDTLDHPGTRTMSITSAYGLGAFVSTPIVLKDGTVYGSLCCVSFEPRQGLNDRDAAFVSVLAEMAAEVIDREREGRRERRAIRHRIEEVLTFNQMTMQWQPIMNIRTGQMVGAEALARFEAEPERSPRYWFEEASRVGLLSELESAALGQALAMLDSLPEGLYLACNLSASAFMSPVVREALEGADLSRVVLELTEHDIVSDYNDLAEPVAEARHRGARIAVDDFGAGYACFSHVLHLRPDLIKLDLSLVKEIDTQETKRSLLAALIGFARASGQTLVAEGVETESELQSLLDLGVDLAQGHVLYKPMPAAELLRLCNQH